MAERADGSPPEQAHIKVTLQAMDADDFEHFVADLWAWDGWETEVTKQSNDKSLDVMAEKRDPVVHRHAIQAKRYKDGNNVSGPKIAEYASLTDVFDADTAVVVTTSDFTRDARDRASDLNVRLVDGDTLVEMIDRLGAYDLVEQYTDTSPHIETSPPEGSARSTTRTVDNKTGTNTDSAEGGILRRVYQNSTRVAVVAGGLSVVSFIVGFWAQESLNGSMAVSVLMALLLLASLGVFGLAAVLSGTRFIAGGIDVDQGGTVAEVIGGAQNTPVKYIAPIIVFLLTLAWVPAFSTGFVLGLVLYGIYSGTRSGIDNLFESRSTERVALMDRSNQSRGAEVGSTLLRWSLTGLIVGLFGMFFILLLDFNAGAGGTALSIGGFVAGLLLFPVGKEMAAGVDPQSSSITPPGTATDDYVLPMKVRLEEGDKNTKSETGHVKVRRDTSTLLAGATRSGKSEATKVLVYQIIDGWRATEPLLAYDRKDDWQQFFTQQGIDFEVLSADPDQATVTWDLFQEVEEERDFETIAKALFDDDEDAVDGSHEFFETASQRVFAVICKYLWRTYGEFDKTPTNEDLVEYVQTTPREEAYEDFSEYDDLRMAATALDPDANRMAAGVWANLTQEVDELFVGTFESPPERLETVSLREYYRTPQGQALVLSHPFKFGDTVERIYKYLIDDSIRRSLGNPGGAVLILDELPQLPPLDNLDELVNVGAGEDVRTLVTVQSVSQMYDTYGKERATSLLAGMPTTVMLRAGDPETLEFYKGTIGQQFEKVISENTDPFAGDTIDERKRDPFDESFLTSMEPGECIVNTSRGWTHGRLYTLENDAREYIDQMNAR